MSLVVKIVFWLTETIKWRKLCSQICAQRHIQSFEHAQLLAGWPNLERLPDGGMQNLQAFKNSLTSSSRHWIETTLEGLGFKEQQENKMFFQ